MIRRRSQHSRGSSSIVLHFVLESICSQISLNTKWSHVCVRHIVYPLVIVAHPKKPNQFAMGLSDGGVQVIEPLKSEGEWGTLTILPYLDP